MELENLSWQTFRKTGDIDAYLLHKALEKNEENQWKALKREESSQNAESLANQIV